VTWENSEPDEPDAEFGPRHQHDIPRGQLPEIMHLVATGQLTQVDDLGWLPGYG
jgi:hypothetical protein